MFTIFKMIGMLFTNPDKFTEPELYPNRFIPFGGTKYMMWCGRLMHKYSTQSNINSLIGTERWTKDMHHESLHINQAQVKGNFPFYYLSYLWEWIRLNPFSESAYYLISYEMEAYAKESDLNYKSTKDSIKRYKSMSYSERKAKWRELGGTSMAWKNYCKTL